jgi:D,D-heptose 1,7-bisphosphate phosphatase
LKRLQQAGYLLIVITNQSGVARGFFDEAEVIALMQAFQKMLKDLDVNLDGSYYCPHHPEGTLLSYSIQCPCRKPNPGMILAAASDLEIDLSQSWMVGDSLVDIEAGQNAGCKTLLLCQKDDLPLKDDTRPDLTAATFDKGASLILSA